MKKTLLLTGVLLALTASFASAAGLNLAWNNCLPAAGSAADKASTCDANTVFDTQVLVGSMISGVAITGTNFTGLLSVMDVQSAQPVGADFWRMGTGECRVGSFGVIFGGSGAITGCSRTLYGPASGVFPVLGWQSSQDGIPNRYRMKAGAARSPGGSMSATIQYCTFEFDMDMNHTDVTDTSTPYCAGCEQPACLVYNDAVISQSDGSETHVNGQATRNWATWQGGVLIPPSICPTSVPTQHKTWGQVKSLYR